ncbi:hypothetical protein [Actinomadura sp. 6K520]|uniref:hypothetical protein n=1 Tax=Actinomadura sp. 6K520 TaxID=2530364 RepID=UPI001043DFB9|nr:hypothetical protein [Actinomadura sp. 6K520]TDE14159.1 hypothetical protein E1289_37170 [Actinomadura sp. 6K520]
MLRPGGGPPENLATVFSDDFANDESGWQSFGDEYGYRDGKYFMRTDNYSETVSRWVPKDDVKTFPDPILATVTATVTEGSPDARYGLLCRANNDRNTIYQYLFLIRNDGKGAVLRKTNGAQGSKELAVTDSVPGFSGDGGNKLQIGCAGQDGGKRVRLRLWVNGEQVIDVTDTDQPLDNGWVGMEVQRGGNKAQQVNAQFDDFDMSKVLD